MSLKIEINYLIVIKANRNIFQSIVENLKEVILQFGTYHLQIQLYKKYIKLYLQGNKGSFSLYLIERVWSANIFIKEIFEKAKSIEFYNKNTRDNIYYDLYKFSKYRKLKKLFNFYITPNLQKHYNKIQQLDYYLEFHPEFKNKIGVIINLIPFTYFSHYANKECIEKINEICPTLFKPPFILEKIFYHRLFKNIILTFKHKKTKSIVEVSSEHYCDLYKMFIKKYKKSLKTVANAILKQENLSETRFKEKYKISSLEWAEILTDPKKLQHYQFEDNF